MPLDEDYRELPPLERPDVVVRIDGTWWPGQLCAWRLQRGAWWAQVTYRTGRDLEDQRAPVHTASVQYNHVKTPPPT